MFESNGSNALKREYEYYEAPKKKVAVKKQPKKLSAVNKMYMLAGVGILFGLAFIVLLLKAGLNLEYKNLSAKKTELTKLTAEIEHINSEIEGSGSIAAIEEKATEMGLVSASESQVVYLSLDNTDKGEILAEDNSNKGIHLFFNKVALVAEYLY